MQSLLWRVEFDAACAGLAASRQVRPLLLLLLLQCRHWLCGAALG